jgi:transglutaminase-like putative cysteine protease
MGQAPPSTLMSIPPGKEGTKYTLNLMRQLVRQGKKSSAVRQLAVELTSGLKQKDWLGEVSAVHRFVRDSIRYVRDIHGVETLHTVERILSNAAGDCDDKSVLVASLLESLGHPTRFLAIGFKPGSYSHVYPETLIGNKWVTVETTEPVELGWKPKNIVNALVMNN